VDRRKLGWILGLLAGLVLIALIMPCGSSDDPRSKRREPTTGEEIEEVLRQNVDRMVDRPPSDAFAGESRFQIEQRLERMRDQRNKAQQVVDRASRGEQVDPAQVEKARQTVTELIPQIEADERRLRELDAE
jgi:hypothetical protein